MYQDEMKHKRVKGGVTEKIHEIVKEYVGGCLFARFGKIHNFLRYFPSPLGFTRILLPKLGK